MKCIPYNYILPVPLLVWWLKMSAVKKVFCWQWICYLLLKNCFVQLHSFVIVQLHSFVVVQLHSFVIVGVCLQSCLFFLLWKCVKGSDTEWHLYVCSFFLSLLNISNHLINYLACMDLNICYAVSPHEVIHSLTQLPDKNVDVEWFCKKKIKCFKIISTISVHSMVKGTLWSLLVKW